jgi:tRNA (cytidine/uridine-2'-O-)-methyltransferase
MSRGRESLADASGYDASRRHQLFATLPIMKYDPLLHIVLYEPDIPPNTGNVGRTCVAVGAKLWLIEPLGFSLDAKQLRRAGLDYWAHLELEVVPNWAECLARLPPRQPWFFSKFAEKSYVDVTYEPGDVLVFGSETSGLPDAMRDEYRDRLLKIPMRPQVRSLNLASACAAVTLEAVRQIDQAAGDSAWHAGR